MKNLYIKFKALIGLSHLTAGLDPALDRLLLKLRAHAIDSEINQGDTERALIFWNAIVALSPNDMLAIRNAKYCENKIRASNVIRVERHPRQTACVYGRRVVKLSTE